PLVSLSALLRRSCRLSADLLVVQEISVSVLGIGTIAERKIKGASRRLQIDGWKDTPGSVAHRAVYRFWEEVTTRLNEHGRHSVPVSHRGWTLTLPDVVEGDHSDDDGPCHTAVAACPSLLNRNSRWPFRDLHLYCSVATGAFRMEHPSAACRQL